MANPKTPKTPEYGSDWPIGATVKFTDVHNKSHLAKIITNEGSCGEVKLLEPRSIEHYGDDTVYWSWNGGVELVSKQGFIPASVKLVELPTGDAMKVPKIDEKYSQPGYGSNWPAGAKVMYAYEVYEILTNGGTSGDVKKLSTGQKHNLVWGGHVDLLPDGTFQPGDIVVCNGDYATVLTNEGEAGKVYSQRYDSTSAWEWKYSVYLRYRPSDEAVGLQGVAGPNTRFNPGDIITWNSYQATVIADFGNGTGRVFSHKSKKLTDWTWTTGIGSLDARVLHAAGPITPEAKEAAKAAAAAADAFEPGDEIGYGSQKFLVIENKHNGYGQVYNTSTRAIFDIWLAAAGIKLVKKNAGLPEFLKPGYGEDFQPGAMFEHAGYYAVLTENLGKSGRFMVCSGGGPCEWVWKAGVTPIKTLDSKVLHRLADLAEEVKRLHELLRDPDPTSSLWFNGYLVAARNVKTKLDKGYSI